MAEDEKAKKKEEIAVDKPILSWESPEFYRYQKSSSWFVAVGGTTLVVAGLLYWQNQISGALVALAGGAVLTMMSGNHPKNVECAIYRNGVVVNKRVYQYSQFKSFGIVSGDLPKAKLDLVGQMSGEVILPLKNIDPEEVREILKKHLPEEEHKGEDLTDFLNRVIKF